MLYERKIKEFYDDRIPMLTCEMLRHSFSKRHPRANRGCLVGALAHYAMLLQSFSKMIKTLHKVSNKMKYSLTTTYTTLPMLANSVYTEATQKPLMCLCTFTQLRSGLRSL